MGEGMRIPHNDERALAAILLEKLKLNSDVRAVLERVESGEEVHDDALTLVRHMGSSYVQASFFEKASVAHNKGDA
jgi:hypothetical protein